MTRRMARKPDRTDTRNIFVFIQIVNLMAVSFQRTPGQSEVTLRAFVSLLAFVIIQPVVRFERMQIERSTWVDRLAVCIEQAADMVRVTVR